MDKQEDEVSFFQTSGFSMWPFLKSGQKIIVKRAEIANLKLGDLILYRADKNIVCHRFINRIKRKDGYFFYAQADASCLSSPEAIKEGAFLGKVIGIMSDSRIISLEQRRQRYINISIIFLAPLLCAGLKIYRLLKGNSPPLRGGDRGGWSSK